MTPERTPISENARESAKQYRDPVPDLELDIRETIRKTRETISASRALMTQVDILLASR
jgi:hypothetical protein